MIEPSELSARDASGVTRVVVVDDHTLVRQSVARLLAAEVGFRVVGEAGRGDEALELVATTRPNLLLIDVSLPGLTGLQVAAEVRKALPGTRVVFLSMHDDDATVHRAIALGADGYLLKSCTADELLQALRAVAAGGSYLSPQVTRSVLRRRRGGDLTDRELEILRLLSSGERPAEVARELFVSVKTVRNHLASIYVKLNVQTAAQAIAEAFRRGLVAPVA